MVLTCFPVFRISYKLTFGSRFLIGFRFNFFCQDYFIVLYSSIRKITILSKLPIYYYLFILSVIDDKCINPLFHQEWQKSNILLSLLLHLLARIPLYRETSPSSTILLPSNTIHTGNIPYSLILLSVFQIISWFTSIPYLAYLFIIMNSWMHCYYYPSWCSNHPSWSSGSFNMTPGQCWHNPSHLS